MNPSRKTRLIWTLPELHVPAPAGVTSTLWHVREGQDIAAGGRLLEVLAGDAAVTLNSPRGGTLIRRLVEEDAPLRRGQQLAILEVDD